MSFAFIGALSPAYADVKLNQILECKSSDQDTADQILNITEQFIDNNNLTTFGYKLINYYQVIPELNWKKLKKSCPLTAFNLFMLNSSVTKNLFSILTAKGFPLSESHDYHLHSVHKKIFQSFTKKLIDKNNCSLPKTNTRVDYRALSTLKEITSHPQYPKHSYYDVKKCIREINKKFKKYEKFRLNSTCHGFSYFINGNLDGTQKGKWIEKDLFCEGYRSYQILKLISDNSNDLISRYSLEVILNADPFPEGKSSYLCKNYFYHPKRMSCYPKL